MNPLHIPRTVLACVGVVIDTAIQMRCQNRDYEAAVRAAAPKSEREPVEAEAERPPYPAASATAAPSPAIPPASDTDPVGVVDGPPASAAPAGPPSELMRGNLIEAAATRAAVPYAPVDDDIDIAAHLYALADRLDAAALVYPTP